LRFKADREIAENLAELKEAAVLAFSVRKWTTL
jgi:hypothetical protein